MRSKASATPPDDRLQLSPAQRAGALIAGALLFLLVVGLYMQLLVLQDSNDEIHAQDAKIADLREEAEPVLKALGPLLDDTRPFLREATKLTGPLSRTADDVSVALEDVPLLVQQSLPLIRLLRDAVPQLTSFVPELRGLVPELRAFFPRAREGVDAALVIERLQREALAIQREQFRIQQETLAVQLEALEHIESIDRKTGGDLQP